MTRSGNRNIMESGSQGKVSTLPVTVKKITIIQDTNEQKPFNFPASYQTGQSPSNITSNGYAIKSIQIDLDTIESNLNSNLDDRDLDTLLNYVDIADNYIDYLLTVKKLKLKTGDYSIKGIEKYAVLERKTLTDLASCIFKPRFSDCINRLLEFDYKAIVVEAGYVDILAHNYKASVGAQRFISWINTLASKGLPVHFAGDRQTAMEVSLMIMIGWYNKINQ